MKVKTYPAYFSFFTVTLMILLIAACGYGPSPPGQAETGYGSSEKYLNSSTEYELYSVGAKDDGTRAWYFLPRVLVDSSKGPVVIFLHGHTAVDYHIYMGHITHLVRQGYIVIYPEYQFSGPSNPYDDLDQTVMLDRAIASVEKALEGLGGHADRNNMVLYGHSLGGLLALCWSAEGGPAASRVVLANANLDPSTGIPAFVLDMYEFTFLDYTSKASATTRPVIILWGDNDRSMAPYDQQEDAYDLLINAASKVIYTAQTDKHGYPPLIADHGAAVQPYEPDGSGIEEDALDFRYFYAALDGQNTLSFDMGSWEDGKPVKPILQTKP